MDNKSISEPCNINIYQSKFPKVYRNILINLSESNKIFEIGTIFSHENNFEEEIYKITLRFYKIYSFENNSISLDYVNKIIKDISPSDVNNEILQFYLKDNVSFISVNEYGNKNTLQIILSISFCNKTKSYKIKNNKSDINCNDSNIIKKIISKISDNLINVLNYNIPLEIDNIFKINDDDVEFCIIHKIGVSKNGWSINYN